MQAHTVHISRHENVRLCALDGTYARTVPSDHQLSPGSTQGTGPHGQLQCRKRTMQTPRGAKRRRREGKSQGAVGTELLLLLLPLGSGRKGEAKRGSGLPLCKGNRPSSCYWHEQEAKSSSCPQQLPRALNLFNTSNDK